MVKGKVAAFLLVFFFGLYFFLSPKMIYGSNDGAHFLLLRNLDIGQIKLDDRLMPYTGYVSFAEYRGERYSDRPPGLALLAAPIYFAAKGLSRVLPFELFPPEMESSISGVQNNTEDLFPARSFGIGIVHLVPILFSAATIALLFLFLCLYTSKVWLSFVLAGLFGLGTLFVKYATVFLSHNVSVFFTMAVVFLLFRIKNSARPLGLREYASLGFCLGFMALLEYQMAVLGLGVLIVIASGYRRFFGISSGLVNKAVLRFLVWGAVPVLAMAYYQYGLFGNPMSTTYSHHGVFLYAHTLAGMFSGNIMEGLRGLLTSPYRHGLFYSSPFILVGVVAALATLRRHRMEKTFLLCVAVAHIFIIANFKEWHGGGFYPRYIIWSALLLYLAGALWCIEAWEICVRRKRPCFYRAESVSLVVFTASAAYGVYANLVDLPLFFTASKVFNLDGLSSYFPGMAHWPLFALMILLPVCWRVCAGLRWGCLRGCAYKVLLLGAFFALAGLFLIYKSSQIPDWSKRNILALENFYVWNTTQADQKHPKTGAEVLPKRYAVNLQGTGGNILYPVAYDQPGVLVYRLPRLAPGARLFLSVDFTITGTGNRFEVTGVGPSGINRPVYAIESEGRETRYWYSKELTGFDLAEEGNLINISLTVKSGSKTLADARLEFLEIYAF
jgi:hypothetical protein